jgi:hypothetical protein
MFQIVTLLRVGKTEYFPGNDIGHVLRQYFAVTLLEERII